MKNKLPGLALTVTIGLLAFALTKFTSIGISSVLIALIAGVIVANTVKLSAATTPGVKFTGKKILEVAIIFLGFGSSFQNIAKLGWQSAVFLVLLILLMLLITFGLSKYFGGKRSTNLLVGFGTAICGSSAIVAVADGVSKEPEDSGIAIAVVNLLGLLGMMVFPAALALVNLTDLQIGAIIGGSLQAVGNVAGAGYAMSDNIGNIALTVKLGRVALLAPGIILFNILLNNKGSIKEHLKLPYYVWGFIAASILVSVVDLGPDLLKLLSTTGKILLTIAMVGIGLSISVKELLSKGKKALGFGVLIFIIQIALVVGLMFLLL